MPLLLLNVAVFVVFMGTVAAARERLGAQGHRRSDRALARRGAASDRRRSATWCCASPILVVGIAATFWGLGAIFFAAVNATESAELAVARR